MGGNAVEVIFGANIAELLAGVQESKEAIQGFAEEVQGLTSIFTGVGEAFVAAFAVEQLDAFIEKLADMGGKVESAAAQLGFSTEKVMGLDLAAKVADMSIDQATKTIQRFDSSAQEAQVATSRQAAAFNSLGINVKEFLAQGHDLNDLFDLTVRKLGEYHDGAEKSVIITDLFGNRSAQTTRLINELSAGLDKWKDKAEALGAPNEQTIEELTTMHMRVDELKTAWENFETSLAPLMNLLVDIAAGFAEFVSIITTGATMIMMTVGAMKDTLEHGYSTNGINAYTTALGEAIRQEKAFIDELENPALKNSGVNKDGKTAPIPNVSGGQASAMQEWEAALKKKELMTDNYYESAKAMEVQYWAAILLTLKAGTAEYDAVLSKLYDAKKGLDADNLRDYRSKLAEEQAAAGDDIQKKIQLEDNYIRILKSYYAKDTEAYNEAMTQRNKLVQQEVNKEEKQYDRLFQSFNQGIDGMITKSMTFQQFEQKTALNIFNAWLKAIEQMVAKWLAKEQVQTAATVAGNAARTASDTGAAAASSQGFGGAAIKQITGDAAKAYGGVYGYLAPEIGPLAAIPAGLAFASVIAMEALIPSFEVGSWKTSAGLSMIHDDEMIIPKGPASAIRAGMGGGGGDTIHVSIQAIDQRGIKDFFTQNGRTIAQVLKQQSGRLNSNVPGWKS